MPAEPTRRGTKRDVHETTTCCACSEYLDYELPEAGSDDIQIPISNCTRQIWDYEVVLPFRGAPKIGKHSKVPKTPFKAVPKRGKMRESAQKPFKSIANHL